METERRIAGAQGGERPALSPKEVAVTLFNMGTLDVLDKAGREFRIKCGKKDGTPWHFVQKYKVERLADGRKIFTKAGPEFRAPSPYLAYQCLAGENLRGPIFDKINSQRQRD